VLCTSQSDLHWKIERKSMKWEISAICLHLPRACRSFARWISVMFLDSQESCMLIWLCSLKFFSFSKYVFLINETTRNLKNIKAKLSSKYHKFLNVFDRVQSNKLSFHCFYNHKIELISDLMLSHCQVY